MVSGLLVMPVLTDCDDEPPNFPALMQFIGADTGNKQLCFVSFVYLGIKAKGDSIFVLGFIVIDTYTGK